MASNNRSSSRTRTGLPSTLTRRRCRRWWKKWRQQIRGDRKRERESLSCSDTRTAVVHFDCDCAHSYNIPSAGCFLSSSQRLIERLSLLIINLHISSDISRYIHGMQRTSKSGGVHLFSTTTTTLNNFNMSLKMTLLPLSFTSTTTTYNQTNRYPIHTHTHRFSTMQSIVHTNFSL
jgi:hypothetical protein